MVAWVAACVSHMGVLRGMLPQARHLLFGGRCFLGITTFQPGIHSIKEEKESFGGHATSTPCGAQYSGPTELLMVVAAGRGTQIPSSSLLVNVLNMQYGPASAFPPCCVLGRAKVSEEESGEHGSHFA